MSYTYADIGVQMRNGKGSKCLLLGLSLGLFLTSFFIAQPVKAHYNPIPADWNVCDSAVNSNVYRVSSDDNDPGDIWNKAYNKDPEAYNSLRNSKAAIFILRDSGGDNRVEIRWIAGPTASLDTATIEGYRANTSPNRYSFRGKVATSDAANKMYSWSTSDQVDETQIWGSAAEYSMTGTTYNSPEPYNEDRVCYAKNLTYDGNWPSGSKPPVANFEGLTAQNPTKGCSAIDIGCWIGKIFDGVIDGFQSLAEGILAGITFLFVPDTEVAEITFNDIMDFITEKLGFLVYPIEWLMDLLDGIVGGIDNDASWGTSICGVGTSTLPTLPGVSGSNFFGGNVSIDWCAIPSVIRNAARVLAQVAIVLVLFHSFKHKLHEVMTK